MTTNQPSATPIRDLSALREQHPNAYTAWVAEGVAQERERIRQHLEMAKLTPAGTLGAGLSLALEAIASGAACDAEMVASYTAAAVNQRDIDARLADDRVASDALDGIATPSADDSFGARVASRFEQLTGVHRG